MEELILNIDETEILYEHLVERQEGCYFVGDICKILEKIKEVINQDDY